MSRSLRGYLNNALFVVIILAATGGWGYVVYNQHRSRDPIEVVRRHFVFYPAYSHGVWREAPCADGEKCTEVGYTVLVQSCGPVTFDWRVFLSDDGDTTWSYDGPTPHFDEKKYPLYATVNDDSGVIESPAFGKPLPPACPASD